MSPSEVSPLAYGRYEFVRRIGRGGSGQVWLARDHRLGRDVAIKRIDVPGHLPDEDRAVAQERIRREARAAARIEHAGVVPLFDVVTGEETVDLVMSFVDAPNLAELVARDGPLDDARAADLGLEVLDVLEAAHAHGVVHRDVKPSNVLVGQDGVRLTDFGIAALADETAMTRTGTALGSPAYLAPEQAQGHPASPEADLWGLGTLLYHAVTGRPPFDRGRPIATMHAVVHDEADPMGDGHPLGPLIRRLLAKDPAARPSTAEIRDELERVSAGATGTDTTALLGAVPDLGATRRIDPVPEAGATRRHDPVPAAPDRADDDRRGVGALLVAAAVLAVVGGLAWALLAPGADDGTRAGTPGVATAPQSDEDADATTPPATADAEEEPGNDATASSPQPQPTPSPEEGATTATEPAQSTTAGEVPEGWEVHEGSTYTVAHPPGWTLRQGTGNRIDLVDPDTGAYLRMDWTDDPRPDPVADWQEKSRDFGARHDDYEEIRIEPVQYRDYDAALWEYAYTDGGARLHAYNLGLTTGERGYALNFQAPESSWDELRGLFDGFKASFQPAP